jgi:hypothetical protein
MEATATFIFYMNRLLAMSISVVAMMIAFFPNRLDPLDRILSNLLDELT